MHVFRSHILRWPVASALLLGTVLWLVVPQAFAASSESSGGWVRQFMDARPADDARHGLQDASDVGSLIVQPVVVPVSVTAPVRTAVLRAVRPADETGRMLMPGPFEPHATVATVSRYLGSSLSPMGP